MDHSQTEVTEPGVVASGEGNDHSLIAPPPAKPSSPVVAPQACATCGTAMPSNGSSSPARRHVYVVGHIEARSPSPSVEKEFAQATGRADTAGLTNRQAVQKVLSPRQNRYLARQLCWVMTIEGLETYILVPHDPGDLDLLIEALRPTPSPMDLDCVIGVRGPIASPETCNGLMVPIVAFDQIYSFDRDALIKAIPRPEKTPAKEFAPAA